MIQRRFRKIRILYSTIILLITISSIPLTSAVTWIQGSQITSNNTEQSVSPAVFYYRQNNTAWTFWSTQGQDGNFDIYYRIMNPNCLQNACLLISYPMHRLTSGPRNNEFTSATETSDGKVWVFFASDRNSGQYTRIWDIFYKTFNGGSWSTDTQLTSWNGTNLHPSAVATSNGGLYVAWASDHNCSTNGCLFNIWLSSFDGNAWSAPQPLTSSGVDFEPSLSRASDGTLWLSWARNTGSKNERDVFYEIRSLQITNDRSDDEWPSVVSVNGSSAVVLVFASDRNNSTGPSYDLFMKYSLNSGASWSVDTELTQNPASDDTEPYATQIGPGRIGILWTADLTGAPNVFSMSILMADVGITTVTPAQTVIGQGQTIMVNVTLTNNGWESESPLVTLFANGTSVGVSLQPIVPYQGTAVARFTWNTAGWARGKYVLNATMSNLVGESNPSNNKLTKLVTLTIPGDVNGDKVVNIADLVSVALVFGTRVGGPGYNSNMDVNLDGIINILDLTFVAARFGSTG